MNTIVFRTTNECNLRCTYCYDCENHSDTISRQIATKQFAENEQAIINDSKKIFQNAKYPQFIFHGGEPLLVDPELLSDFCQKLNQDLLVKYSIQTNSTLIDENAINLFKKNNFRVGISLDGANEKQNGARIYNNGTNSFNTVIQKIKFLQQEHIKFGVVISINKLHIGQEQQLYDFLAENHINCNIRPVFATLNGDNSLVMTKQEYITFFNNLFDIWYNDVEKRVKTEQIMEFYQELQKILSKENYTRSCECSPNCFLNFISLDTNGEVYACNRLYKVEQFHYGNIRQMDMSDVEAKALKLLQDRNQNIKDKCGDCSCIKECYGGCPAEAYATYGRIDIPSDSCQIKKEISEHIKKRVLI